MISPHRRPASPPSSTIRYARASVRAASTSRSYASKSWKDAVVFGALSSLIVHGTRSITFYSAAVRSITLSTVSTLLTVFGDLANVPLSGRRNV
jgi:hypothetical protein